MAAVKYWWIVIPIFNYNTHCDCNLRIDMKNIDVIVIKSLRIFSSNVDQDQTVQNVQPDLGTTLRYVEISLKTIFLNQRQWVFNLG